MARAMEIFSPWTQEMNFQAASCSSGLWFLGMAQPHPPLSPCPPGMTPSATLPETFGHLVLSPTCGSIHQYVTMLHALPSHIRRKVSSRVADSAPFWAPLL